MAEQGRRDVVGDPLALNVAAQPAVRDLATMAVRNPGQTGGDAVYRDQMQAMSMLGELGTALGGVMKAKEDEWVTQGKLKFMQGATEQEIAASGNKYTMQGWQSLNAVDKANNWYAQELVNIDAAAKSMQPAAYNEFLMKKRSEFMQNLPDDPAIQKLYIAAFEDLAPRLSSQQTAAHNEWNKEQMGINFSGALGSGSYTNSDASSYTPGGPGIALSSGVVRSTVQYTAPDVAALTRVILGEARGEGPQGMAAVAHVALNRVIDGGYGNGWADVLRPDQFNGAVTGARFDKESAAYKQAEAIAINVLGGHSVDPTNGRTHFVSGGIRPDWWAAEEAKGNIIKIGNHEFVGQARNLGTHSQSQSTGNLIFAHEGQDQLEAPFASMLSATGRQLGIDLNINSGYRDPAHDKAVGGSGEGQHTHGNAADIDMSGMDDNERANLVRTLRQNGATRFITYSNTNHLHVDTAAAPNGQAEWFMHDSSNSNIDKAPDWFKAIMQEPRQAGGTSVAADAGSDPLATSQGLGIPTGESQSIAQTQAQDFVRNYPLPPAEKAAFVAGEMFTQLQAGSTQLWDDLGGVGFLQEMGATPQQIRQVQAGYEAFQDKKLTEYSRERTEWMASIPQRIKDGTLLPEDAKDEVDARFAADGISDQQATSLINTIVQEEYALGNAVVQDPAFSRAVATIWTRLQDPNTYTAEEAQSEIEMLAGQFGVPKGQVEQLIGQAWSREEQARNALTTSLAQAEKDKATRDAKVREVTTALGNGFGLQGVTGSIDGMPAQQWGVEQRAAELREAEKGKIGQYMAEGLDEQQAQLKASANAEAALWRELMSQGNVVQDGLKNSMTAELSGMATSTTFVMTDGIKQTFDTYQRMLRVDPTGTYASAYLGNDAARSLMMNAQRFYSGGLEFEDAMRNAHEFLRNGITTDSVENISNVQGFNGMLGTAIRDNFGTLMGNPDWLTSSGVTAQDKSWAEANDTQLRKAVTDRAWTYYADRPMDDPSVLIKMAAQDVLRDSVIVGGNIMTPTSAGGTPVLEQMGLQGYSNDTANKAVSEYLKWFVEEERASNPNSAWVKEWDARGPDYAARGMAITGLPPGASAFNGMGDQYLQDPAYYASWNPDAGQMVVTLWNDTERKFTVPAEKMPPLQLDLAEVGEWYKARHQTQGANDFQNMWGNLFGQPAKTE